jgi:hypothetical protein
MHGLADEFSEASRKRRATEPHAKPEVAKEVTAVIEEAALGE